MPVALPPGIQAALLDDAANWAYLLELVAPSATIRFTSWGTPLTYLSQVWVPRAFTWQGLETGLELRDQSVECTVDNVDLAVSALVANQDVDGLSTRLYLVCPDVPGEALEKFRGYLRVESVNEDICAFTVAPDTLRARDEVRPQRTFGATCDWRFADPATCGANPGEVLAQVAGTVAVSGNTLTVEGSGSHPRTEPTLPADPGSYWADGFLTFTTGAAAGVTLKVRKNDPTTPPGLGTVTLDTAPPVLPAPGDLYTLRKGCNRSFRVCRFRHANEAFFGGWVNIPGAGNTAGVTSG